MKVRKAYSYLPPDPESDIPEIIKKLIVGPDDPAFKKLSAVEEDNVLRGTCDIIVDMAGRMIELLGFDYEYELILGAGDTEERSFSFMDRALPVMVFSLSRKWTGDDAEIRVPFETARMVRMAAFGETDDECTAFGAFVSAVVTGRGNDREKEFFYELSLPENIMEPYLKAFAFWKSGVKLGEIMKLPLGSFI